MKKENTTQVNAEIEDHRRFQESFERASVDLELLCSAYPDEISILHTSTQENPLHLAMDDDTSIPTWFPLRVTLTLPSLSNEDQLSKNFGAKITMEFPRGYPATKSLEILSYRGPGSSSKEHIEAAVSAVRNAAHEALHEYGGEECALACCAAAFESWRLSKEQEEQSIQLPTVENEPIGSSLCINDDIHWVTSEKTLVDRKSVFQAHVCPISSEDMVRRGLEKLVQGSNKIQRASHNMYAYRFTEILPDGKEILKHDNDDDGEDAAGSRLAQLLEMRKEDGLLIVVSRWYGGIHLGPKRFAHIVNVARELLTEFHMNKDLSN